MEKHFEGKVAAKAIVVQGDKILIVRDNKDADTWEFPGGRINEGENIEAALRRELMEELGVEVEILNFVHSHQTQHIKSGILHLFIVFAVKLVDPKAKFKLQPEELAEAKWVTENESKQFKYFPDGQSAIEVYWKQYSH